MTTIRPALPSDRKRIEVLVAAAYGHYVERIGATPGPMRDDYGAHIAAGYVSLLFDGAELVGVLVLIPKPSTLLLDNVAISPAAQGRGFGRLLMRHAETRARELGHDNVTLYTQERMHENLVIYRRYGYVETHRTEELGLKRVYLRKMLS